MHNTGDSTSEEQREGGAGFPPSPNHTQPSPRLPHPVLGTEGKTRFPLLSLLWSQVGPGLGSYSILGVLDFLLSLSVSVTGYPPLSASPLLGDDTVCKFRNPDLHSEPTISTCSQVAFSSALAYLCMRPSTWPPGLRAPRGKSRGSWGMPLGEGGC